MKKFPIFCNRDGCGPAELRRYIDSEGVEVFVCGCSRCGQLTNQHLTMIAVLSIWYSDQMVDSRVVVMEELEMGCADVF